MHFYWGARKLADLYMLDMAKQWEQAGIKFTPVLSEALPEDAWTGRTGFVHHAVMADYADLSGHDIYACGAPVVVEAAHTDFTKQRGALNENFYSDAFTFAPKS
jgi:CDP-4-dehydro-6-deoxyglucose reductase, E3